jgi:hypothetical protein
LHAHDHVVDWQGLRDALFEGEEEEGEEEEAMMTAGAGEAEEQDGAWRRVKARSSTSWAMVNPKGLGLRVWDLGFRI